MTASTVETSLHCPKARTRSPIANPSARLSTTSPSTRPVIRRAERAAAVGSASSRSVSHSRVPAIHSTGANCGCGFRLSPRGRAARPPAPARWRNRSLRGGGRCANSGSAWPLLSGPTAAAATPPFRTRGWVRCRYHFGAVRGRGGLPSLAPTKNRRTRDQWHVSQ